MSPNYKRSLCLLLLVVLCLTPLANAINLHKALKTQKRKVLPLAALALPAAKLIGGAAAKAVVGKVAGEVAGAALNHVGGVQGIMSTAKNLVGMGGGANLLEPALAQVLGGQGCIKEGMTANATSGGLGIVCQALKIAPCEAFDAKIKAAVSQYQTAHNLVAAEGPGGIIGNVCKSTMQSLITNLQGQGVKIPQLAGLEGLLGGVLGGGAGGAAGGVAGGAVGAVGAAVGGVLGGPQPQAQQPHAQQPHAQQPKAQAGGGLLGGLLG